MNINQIHISTSKPQYSTLYTEVTPNTKNFYKEFEIVLKDLLIPIESISAKDFIEGAKYLEDFVEEHNTYVYVYMS